MSDPFISAVGLTKRFLKGKQEIVPIQNISFQVKSGEFVSLMGPSGSGKTTLLNLLAGIDSPTEGTLLIGSQTIHEMSREELTKWRSLHVGYIFQLYHLMPVLTAFENVELPIENIIVPAGGFKKLMEAFDLERCGNTTMSLACAQSAYDFVLKYVQERKQFGKPIVDFQAVQIQLAEMKMKLDSSRLLLYRAVVNADTALPSIADSSIAKCYANEIAREVTGKAVQLMGGYGYSSEFPLEQKMRDAWGWGIAGGAIDIQKTNITSALIGRRFNQRN